MNSKIAPKAPALGQHNPFQTTNSTDACPVLQLGQGLSVTDGFPSEPGHVECERRRMAVGGFEEAGEVTE